MSIQTLSAVQLRKAADLKDRIDELEQELNQLLGTPATPRTKPAKKKRGMSAAGKAKVVAAQKLR